VCYGSVASRGRSDGPAAAPRLAKTVFLDALRRRGFCCGPSPPERRSGAGAGRRGSARRHG
jgi:hypothetical protein